MIDTYYFTVSVARGTGMCLGWVPLTLAHPQGYIKVLLRIVAILILD